MYTLVGFSINMSVSLLKMTSLGHCLQEGARAVAKVGVRSLDCVQSRLDSKTLACRMLCAGSQEAAVEGARGFRI